MPCNPSHWPVSWPNPNDCRDYREAEVNEIAQGWFEDHAMLRRYLVDWGMMNRADGVYRRTGS